MKILINLLIFLALAVMFTGCAMVSYQTADGTKVTYSRFLSSADSLRATVGGATAEVNGQKIDTQTLQALMQLLGAAGK